MPPALPRNQAGSAEWAGGYTSPKDLAAQMFREREIINAKTKLTWAKDRPPAYNTDRMIGEVNLAAPYIRMGTRQPGKVYYIQNCSFFKSNGLPTTMEEISVIERNDPELIASLYAAEEMFLKDAANRDDALCKICTRFRSASHEDYLKHIMTVHPDHALKVAGIPEAPIASVRETGPTCCGKTFKNARGLDAHVRFDKKNHGA